MSGTDLDVRLAAMRAEMQSRGLLQRKQPTGEPWVYSVPAAAVALGIPRLAVQQLIAAGLLPVEHLDEPVIAAVHVRRLKAGRT